MVLGVSVMQKCYVRDTINIPILSGGNMASFVSFAGLGTAKEHVAITVGDLSGSPLVRIHSECLTGDVFGSHRCDCGPQLRESLELIVKDGGALIYLRQEGRGIGLYEKLAAYRLQDTGLDTFEANTHLNHPEDGRDFSDAANMLTALGVGKCRLMTNNPDKVSALQEAGIFVEQVIPTGVFLTKYNERYLSAKADKKKHSIDLHGMP
jgi:GTP cyclohydrolase II